MAARAIDRAKVLPVIYGEVAAGRALDNVLTDDGMPSPATFWRWHMEDADIRDNLARARENGVERHVGEIVRIADDLEEPPESRKVRIYARVQSAQMIAPRKYGPKLDVTSGGDAIRPPTQTLAIQVAALLNGVVARIKQEENDGGQ